MIMVAVILAAREGLKTQFRPACYHQQCPAHESPRNSRCECDSGARAFKSKSFCRVVLISRRRVAPSMRILPHKSDFSRVWPGCRWCRIQHAFCIIALFSDFSDEPSCSWSGFCRGPGTFVRQSKWHGGRFRDSGARARQSHHHGHRQPRGGSGWKHDQNCFGLARSSKQRQLGASRGRRAGNGSGELRRSSHAATRNYC